MFLWPSPVIADADDALRIRHDDSHVDDVLVPLQLADELGLACVGELRAGAGHGLDLGRHH